MSRISYRFLVPGWSAKPLVSAHDRIMGTHRRSLSLRAIPEADPHFTEIFGAREDIESTFSNLKYLMRGKLKSTNDDQSLFTFTAYMLMWMSRAKTAYYKSVNGQWDLPGGGQ